MLQVADDRGVDNILQVIGIIDCSNKSKFCSISIIMLEERGALAQVHNLHKWVDGDNIRKIELCGVMRSYAG